jgi:uncharacterized membrane protein YczE
VAVVDFGLLVAHLPLSASVLRSVNSASPATVARVHAAPRLRGGWVVRSIWLVTGLFLCALGIVCFLESKLGLAPWDVLHQGVAKHTSLSFGVANIVVAVVILVLAWTLGSHPGPGTVANAILTGGFVAVLQQTGLAHDVAHWPLLARAFLPLAGVVLLGVGSAFYIGAALGAGPRDSLMLVGARRLHTRIGVVRAGLELSVLVIGFALGGTVGVGTLVFAALIGPAVEGSFWLVARSPLVE